MTFICPDEECKHEFTRSEATLDWECFLTEPTELDGSGAEFHLDTKVELYCPLCGEGPVHEESGETRFNVEMG